MAGKERDAEVLRAEAKELIETRGKLIDKEVVYNIKVKPFKLFRKFYVKKQGL